MTTPRIISYVRVSTDGQGRSGLGIEAQRQLVTSYIDQTAGEHVREYVEIESGKVDDRPELHAAIRNCRRIGATLVVAKLDRLSRNATFLLTFDDMVKRAGIDLHVCDQPHLDRFMLGIHALVAERERHMISDRTKAALAVARARGVRLGTRNGKRLSEAGCAARRSKALQHAENVMPIISQIQATGALTYRAIADALNARGISTAQGGEWHAASVRRTMVRHANQ